MVQEYRSFYLIGLYDPDVDDSWPWDHRYDEGIYLSSKKRVCKLPKASALDTPEQAKEFFSGWAGSTKWKMKLIETKRWVDIPEPEYAADHPASILKAINKSEGYSVYVTAELWFAGKLKKHYVTKKTLKRHRIKLLAYNIDIDKKPKQRYDPSPPKVDKVWHLSSSSKDKST